jgi:fatty acid desaturase
MHSLLYSNPLDHHNPRKYETPADGEYLPLASAPFRETLLYLAQIPFLPVLAVFRFLILVPLLFLQPRWRQRLLAQRFSYGSNPYDRRVLSPTENFGLWAVLDLAGFCLLALVFAMVLKGWISWMTMALLYVLATCAIGLNRVRTLAAHRYVNTGRQKTYAEQLEDSLTIDNRSLFTALLFPVGSRYHALHHLFPSPPYHAFGVAHRRLLQTLPADSPYRRTIRTWFIAAVRELLARASLAATSNQNPMHLWFDAKVEP